MEQSQKALLEYLSKALVCSPIMHDSWGGSDDAADRENGELDEQVKNEALAQSVFSLIGTEADAFYIIRKNAQLCYEQEQLHQVLKSIPYVVLKGLAAAIYYPDPLRRTLGDIDIIVQPEDFSRAYNTLVNAGYKTDDPETGDSRHVHFMMNGVTVELHRKYAALNSVEQEELLDSWIFDAEAVEGRMEDQTFPMLPPLLNGLTLLAHINQHLEDGLGIRHILDWVMYVHRCLPDEKWRDFAAFSDQLGLTKLAIVTARIGQLYLHAYPDYSWCAGGVQSGEVAPGEVDKLAEELLEYCFTCGNFGFKLGQDNAVTMVMSHGKGVDGFFRNLQKRGEENWEALSIHPELRPFAWLYQAGRYIKKGLAAGVKMDDLKRNVDESKKRNQLMEQLGVKQQSLRDRNGE